MKFILWKWQDKNWRSRYNAEHVSIAADMIRRNYKGQCEIYCCTDDANGLRGDIIPAPLPMKAAHLGHCYRRLELFAPEYAKIIGGKFVSVDLDAVITGDLTQIIDCSPDFAIMKDYQGKQPYNGSFWIHQPSTRPQVWQNFYGNEQAVIKQGDRLGFTACDQKVMATILGVNERVYDAEDGFISYKLCVRNKGNLLPFNAKFVAFHGSPKPEDCLNIDWVAKHYRKSKRAIVLGGADCVWDDLASLGNLADTADIIAVNDSGYAYEGEIKYWVSLHPEKFKIWEPMRAARTKETNYIKIGYAKQGKDKRQELSDEYTQNWRNAQGVELSGSSGLFAAKVALEKGYDEIILCGVPMDCRTNIHRGKQWAEFKNYTAAWEAFKDKLLGKVRSQSGWTKNLLGCV